MAYSKSVKPEVKWQNQSEEGIFRQRVRIGINSVRNKGSTHLGTDLPKQQPVEVRTIWEGALINRLR